ncbi:glutathione S-transferase family protein [Thalassolituus alkanivorans]|uniref:glutathione S-transferase family protein n=1 Tax=Thalassolituus alkanivorans TaxID=2881055 RepID=UPI001E3D447E|nr:glutathione S-transferase family protein [Thalassolituus alkanivorans]MCB2386435.1 glutathione S-transferase family protein [Thalassolituus alkanivorans]MCB2422308.1 glutathione S-transferase family protein [Thalassolituus alkanivorans]
MNNAVLYQYEISPFCAKVRRVLQLKGLDYQVHNIGALGSQLGEVRRLSPQGKLPVLELDGERMADSSLIVRELERRFPAVVPLIPDDEQQRAQVHLWEDWADESLYFLEVYLRFAVKENRGYWAGRVCAADPAWFAAIARPIVPATMMKQLKAQGMGRKSLAQVLAELDQHLQMLNALLYGRDWLVGEQLTLADIAVAVQLQAIAATPQGQKALQGYPQIQLWLARSGEPATE